MPKLKALIIGESFALTFAIPHLLARSGFEVDLISTCEIFEKSRFISNFDLISDINLAPQKAAEKNLDEYDFITISDDIMLKIIADSNLDIATKLKLLPIKNAENLRHLYSKIELSFVLSESGITTPDFIIAKTQEELIDAAEKLGFPVMVKIDSACAGDGVFECKNIDDIKNLRPDVCNQKLLVQKKISGIEFDLSGLYRDGKLIYFSYSEFVETVSKCGPSRVRLYHQLATIEETIFKQLQQLGKALGANGFVNISCIKSDIDNKIYFFEADMRPNTWVEFGRFIGDDPAARIKDWFLHKKHLENLPKLNENYPKQLTIPYFLRLKFIQILKNKNNAWKYLLFAEYKILIKLLIQKFSKIIASLRRLYRHPKLIFRPILLILKPFRP